MRIVLDASAARFGGLRTVVVGLVQAWTASFPEDHLTVLADRELLPADSTADVMVTRGSLAAPTLANSRLIRDAVRASGANVFVGALPLVPLVAPGVPMAVLCHDVRHEVRRNDFPLKERTRRTLGYLHAYRRAHRLFTVSRRTLDDIARLHPWTREKLVLTSLGCDHARSWSAPSERPAAPYVVAPGHFVNKNVELLVRAWPTVIAAAGPHVLVLTGVDEPTSASVRAMIRNAGLDDGLVRTHPLLHQGEYEAVVLGASAFVMPSLFEGFGLPVLEAMVNGVPVAVSPDPALAEISGNHAATMRGWSVSALSDAVIAALNQPIEAREAARLHASTFTWASTASAMREALADVIG